MAQQTAVEWLVNELQLHGYDFTISHAKEMEKEQAIEFAKYCLDKALDLDIRTIYSNVEQHYNKIYGNEGV